jgi:hypothetical protein
MTREKLVAATATRYIPSASGDVPLQPGSIESVSTFARSIVAQVQNEINADNAKAN